MSVLLSRSLCLSFSLALYVCPSLSLSMSGRLSRSLCLSFSLALYVCPSLSLSMSGRLSRSLCLPFSLALYVCPSLSLSMSVLLSRSLCLSFSLALYVWSSPLCYNLPCFHHCLKQCRFCKSIPLFIYLHLSVHPFLSIPMPVDFLLSHFVCPSICLSRPAY